MLKESRNVVGHMLHVDFNKLLLFSRFVVLLQIVIAYSNRYEIFLEMRMSQCISMAQSQQVLLTKVFLKFSRF